MAARNVQRFRQPCPVQRLPRGVQPDAHPRTMARGGTEPGATRGYLADRQRAGPSPTRRRHQRIYRTTMGFPPARPKGAPVINFRSEGRRFPVGRCLIPASHFFEFTGKKSPKTKWKFTKVGEDWFCFAGLWRPTPDGGAAFTLLTTEPGSDVSEIHDRQMVVLNRSEWSAWLEQTGNEAAL
jgi:putative SOS response-associated peptidase YedK